MKKTLIIAVVILLLGALIFFNTDRGNDNNQFSGDTLRVGYIIFPPSLKKDAVTGELSGFSYDIVEVVANKLGLQTEWTEEVGWGTALEGLNTNRYDVLGTLMWPNEERERVAQFSIAPMDSVFYAYAREGDTRFDNDLSILNSRDYTISTLDGEMSTFVAKEDFPLAKTISLPQLSSSAEQFLNVVQGKADITFSEPSAMEDFLKARPNTLEKVKVDAVRSFGNSFAFNKKDTEMVKKWDKAIQELLDDGTIRNLLEKYGVEDYYIIN